MMDEKKDKKKSKSKYTPEQLQEIYDGLKDFIDGEPDPMIARFCIEHPVGRKYMLLKRYVEQNPMFDDLRAYAQQKEETFLVDAGMENPKHTPIAIFRLKQPRHGYVDRVQQDITTSGERINFINTVPRPIATNEKNVVRNKLDQYDQGTPLAK